MKLKQATELHAFFSTYFSDSEAEADEQTTRTFIASAPSEQVSSILSQAKQLDESCALQSESWGRFQLMGENWKSLGYASVQEFVAQHEQSESLQFEAFLRYCETKSGEVDDKKWMLIDALRQENWHVVFSLYNGKNYKKLGYDTKFLRVMNRLDPNYKSAKAA